MSIQIFCLFQVRNLVSETDSIKENNITECKPCKLKDCVVSAIYWCVDCGEQICEACEEVHRRLAVTKTHTVTPLKEILSRKNNQLECLIDCFCCECHKADVYCENHNEVICSECCHAIHNECATFAISKLNNHMSVKLRTATSDKAESVISQLSNIEASRRKDRSALQDTKNMCAGKILLFHSELKNCLDDLKLEALRDLSNQEAKQKMEIDSCISDCDFIRQTINSEVKSLQSVKTEYKSIVFLKNVQLFKFLKEAEERIDAMKKKKYFHQIRFEKKFTLDKFRSEITSLGKSTCELWGNTKERL